MNHYKLAMRHLNKLDDNDFEKILTDLQFASSNRLIVRLWRGEIMNRRDSFKIVVKRFFKSKK